MFVNITIDDYDFRFELQESLFLKDCLYPEINFNIESDNLLIYKLLAIGIYTPINIDELIYFIHFNCANYFKINDYKPRLDEGISLSGLSDKELSFFKFSNIVYSISKIKEKVNNMKILLKYL